MSSRHVNATTTNRTGLPGWSVRSASHLRPSSLLPPPLQGSALLLVTSALLGKRRRSRSPRSSCWPSLACLTFDPSSRSRESHCCAHYSRDYYAHFVLGSLSFAYCRPHRLSRSSDLVTAQHVVEEVWSVLRRLNDVAPADDDDADIAKPS